MAYLPVRDRISPVEQQQIEALADTINHTGGKP